jgi:AraC family transcriptional regulator
MSELVVFQERPVIAKPRRRACRGLASWQVERLHVYIESHLGQALTISELARVACLSPSHFCHVFPLAFGLPAHRYVMLMRVRRAQALMLSTPEGLSSIAAICGMCDQAHLTRCFRRVVGQTPGAWRRTQRRPESGRAPPAHSRIDTFVQSLP